MKNVVRVLSAHPIDDAIRARVLQALDQIETEYDVKVLFACESGSRGGLRVAVKSGAMCLPSVARAWPARTREKSPL